MWGKIVLTSNLLGDKKKDEIFAKIRNNCALQNAEFYKCGVKLLTSNLEIRK